MMRRSVFMESRLWLAVVAGALFVGMLLTETGTALLTLLVLAVVGVAMKVEEKPPRWLLRTPLGRWLRR
jgi:hypothetical protein